MMACGYVQGLGDGQDRVTADTEQEGGLIIPSGAKYMGRGPDPIYGTTTAITHTSAPSPFPWGLHLGPHNKA